MDEYEELDDIENIAILDYLERRERTVHPDRGNDLDDLDDVDFKTRYRLNKHTFEALLRMLNEKLSSETTKNNAVTPLQKLCIGLRYFANGAYQLLIGDVGKVSQPSVSRSIKEVAEAIAELRPKYICLPQTEIERQQV